MMKKYILESSMILTICLIFWGGIQSVCAQVKTLEADIVIIGGGGAGTTAALTAIQEGVKNVVLLEKQAYLGGTSAAAGGMIWGAESHIQKAAGMNTDKDEAFQEHMEFNHYDRVDSKVVRAFIEKTADTMKWLEDNGVMYRSTSSFGESGGYTHYPVDDTGPTHNFGRSITKLANKFTAAGGQVLLNTGAEKILRGPDGKINGVIAANKKGETILISTKAVILATGGFGGSEELLNIYFQEYWNSGAYGITGLVKTNTGDGIKLAEDAGAGLNNWATLVREPPRGSGGLWVNKRGERFQNETWSGNAAANAMLKQPGKVAYSISDSKRSQGTGDFSAAQGQNADLINSKMKESMPKSETKVSDSWDEIARWIGADPKVLKATVEEYNSFCKQGHDPVFGKDPKSLNALVTPPFTATKLSLTFIDTYGPVRINGSMAVLDKNDNPIPGFYAGGAICGQIQGNDYHFFGGALSFAVNSGRIAAENAARYISGK
jgi:fumarate reductase flavoprotein subunit